MVAEIEGGQAFKQQNPLQNEVARRGYVHFGQRLRELVHQLAKIQLRAVDVLYDHILENFIKTEGREPDLLVDV